MHFPHLFPHQSSFSAFSAHICQFWRLALLSSCLDYFSVTFSVLLGVLDNWRFVKLCIICISKMSPIVCEMSVFMFRGRFTLSSSQDILSLFEHPLGMGYSACRIFLRECFNSISFIRNYIYMKLKFCSLWVVTLNIPTWKFVLGQVCVV